MTCLALASCGVKVYTSKGNAKKTFVIKSAFNAIKTVTNTDIEYMPGAPSVTLSAPPEIIHSIDIVVRDSVLVVYMNYHENLGNVSNIKTKLIVSYPGVNTFLSSGTGDIEIKNVNVETLTLSTNGTGDIECKDSKCKFLIATTYGTGDIELEKFSCITAKLSSNGTGDIEAEKFTADTVEASTTGTGDINISGVCKSITKESDGTGDINFYSKSAK